MLEYFNQLNTIVTFLSDNSKIPMKIASNKGQSQKEKKTVDPSVNNDRILERYRKEEENIEKRLKKYNDPEYKIKLETEKIKITEDIKNYEKKIKNSKAGEKSQK